jgi:hypothetical protein
LHDKKKVVIINYKLKSYIAANLVEVKIQIKEGIKGISFLRDEDES